MSLFQIPPTVLESLLTPISLLQPPPRFTGGRVFNTGKRGSAPGSFGQPRFPKALNLQLRV